MKKRVFIWITSNRKKKLLLWFKRKIDFFQNATRNVNNDHKTNGETWLQFKIAKTEPKIVFDVGANKGDWSLSILDQTKTTRVHSFEPNPEVFLKLEQKLKNHRERNIANLCALAYMTGKQEFSINSKNNIFSSFYRRINDQDAKSIEVSMISGDQYCRENSIDEIDFLKIDVEGFELEVLKGFSDMIAEKRIKVIQFEYGIMNIHARTFLKDFFDLLEPQGYSIGKLFPKDIEFVKYTYSLDNFEWANYVAVRKDIDMFSSFEKSLQKE